MQEKLRTAFLTGRGSRLPNILEKILTPDSGVSVTIVVSHRKPPEGANDVAGILEAKKRGIVAIYWNLAQMKASDNKTHGNWDEATFRTNYMRFLGAFLTQQNYKPDLIVMTGWDLVLDENFTAFFKDIPVLNVHPHPLPDGKEDTIIAPDGKEIQVLRGTEVWVKAIEQKLPWSGVTIHKVIPAEYDVGKVIAREWVKIDPQDTAETLRTKLNEAEDKIVPETILKIAKGEITV